MTITPPVVGPIDVSAIPNAFRAHTDVQPFTYRSAMTYTQLLESMRVWTLNQLIPYLNTNFEDIQGSWVENVTNFVQLVNAGLAQQSADNAAAIAQGLSDIANSSVSFTNQALTDAFNATTSSFRAAMDDHFGTSAVSDASVSAVIDSSQTAAKIDSRAKAAVQYGTRMLIVNDLPNIKMDGSADASGILATAITSLVAGSYTNLVVLPTAFGKSTLRIDSTLTLDISKGLLVAPYGALELRATNNTTTEAIRVTASQAVPNNSQTGGPKLGPFRLTGPGRAVTASTGIIFATRPGDAGQVRGIASDSVTVEEFYQGHLYGDNAYCIDHYNASIKGCTTDIVIPTGTNMGERITYHGGTFSDSPNVVNCSNGNADLYFTNCSFDYFTQSAVVVNNGNVTLRDCHIEAATVAGQLWFQHHGGNLNVLGGVMLRGGTSTTPDYIVWSDADATTGLICLFENVHMNSMTTGNFQFGGGSGPIVVRGTRNWGGASANFSTSSNFQNLFYDGSFDLAASFTDQWLLWSDTATIADSTNSASSLTGTNVTATYSTDIKRSGTKSLKITKTGAAGTSAAVAVAVPIRAGSLVGHQGYVARHVALTGTFTVTNYYTRLRPTEFSPTRTQPGAVLQLQQYSFNTGTDLPSVDTWVPFRSQTFQRRVPGWATHYLISIDLTAMGAGSLYLDDLIATEH